MKNRGQEVKKSLPETSKYNNRNIKWMNKNKNKNKQGKQLRKPISNNFAPKRLAINFDPPMIIMEYLVVDTGKLYHHKMRLDSVLRKPKVTRDDVLNYIKTKHHLYFVSGKVKDAQLFKFIDKLLLRKGIISKPDSSSQPTHYAQPAHSHKEDIVSNNASDDFDYLNDQEQQEYYEEDYEDYEDASNYIGQKKGAPTKQVTKAPEKKNAFLAYCQQYEDREEQEGHAEWDLDMDQNDDFV